MKVPNLTYWTDIFYFGKSCSGHDQEKPMHQKKTIIEQFLNS